MRYITLFIFLLSLIAINGCKQPADLDIIQVSPRLVAISNFAPGNPFIVRLSATESVLEEDQQKVLRNANIEIWTAGAFLEELNFYAIDQDSGAYYRSELTQPVSGATYQTVITNAGFPSIQASDIVPYAVPIGRNEVSDLVIEPDPINPGFFNYSFNVLLTFPDEPETVDQYHVFTYLRDFQQSGLLSPLVDIDSNDPNLQLNFDESSILVEDGGAISDSIRLNYSCNFSANTGTGFNELIIELRHISESYFLYYRSLNNQAQTSGDPFAEPVLLFNNVENGFGNFSGYAARFDTIDFN